MLAAQQGHTDTVSVLIDGAADLNHTENHGYTAMSTADYCGHIDTVQFLLDQGAASTDANWHRMYHLCTNRAWTTMLNKRCRETIGCLLYHRYFSHLPADFFMMASSEHPSSARNNITHVITLADVALGRLWEDTARS